MAEGLSREFVQPTPEAAAIRAGVDHLLALVAAAAATVGTLHQRPIHEALAGLEAIDIGALKAAASELEQQAVRLRPAASPAPSGPDAAPGGPLTRRLRATLQRIEAAPLHPTPPKPPPRRLPEPALVREKQILEGNLTLATEILAFCRPRLGLFKLALDAVGLPARRKPWLVVEQGLNRRIEAGALSATEVAWLPHIARLFYDDEEAARRTHMALVALEEAERHYEEAVILKSALEGTAPERQAAVFAAYSVGPLRAALAPLTRLHVHFAGLTHLTGFFPPPETAPARPAGYGFKALFSRPEP